MMKVEARVSAGFFLMLIKEVRHKMPQVGDVWHGEMCEELQKVELFPSSGELAVFFALGAFGSVLVV
jgi:hypothetical protein